MCHVSAVKRFASLSIAVARVPFMFRHYLSKAHLYHATATLILLAAKERMSQRLNKGCFADVALIIVS